jgi:hypothetical protein
MPENSLPKTYDFKITEQSLYDWWEKNGYFAPSNDPQKPGFDPSQKTFVIAIPPANVTGELHLGHAMFVSMEDLMIRYHRMKGDSTLWVPGTDHAGIATQLQVEKALAQEGLHRDQLGRDEFLKRTWAWKEKIRWHYHPPNPPPGRLMRLEPRTVYTRSWPFLLGAGGLRATVRKRSDLPRPAHDQLVARAAHGGFGSGSGIF